MGQKSYLMFLIFNILFEKYNSQQRTISSPTDLSQGNCMVNVTEIFG